MAKYIFLIQQRRLRKTDENNRKIVIMMAILSILITVVVIIMIYNIQKDIVQFVKGIFKHLGAKLQAVYWMLKQLSGGLRSNIYTILPEVFTCLPLYAYELEWHPIP